MGSLKITDFEAVDESSLKNASFERHKRLFVSIHQSSQLNANSPGRNDNPRQDPGERAAATPAPPLGTAATESCHRDTEPGLADRCI